MKLSLFLVPGLLLALFLLPAPLGAQKTTKPFESPRTVGSMCQAEGAECLFGNAGGCAVFCEPGQKAHCEGAWCFLGFPRAAKCYCK